MNKMYSKSVKNPIDKGLPLTMAFRNDYPPHKTPRNNKPHLRWIFFTLSILTEALSILTEALSILTEALFGGLVVDRKRIDL